MKDLLGKQAPGFVLRDKDGIEHDLKHIEADYIILYFYPKDLTAGCTLEAQEFSLQIKEFTKRGAKIIGISGGDELSKRRFCEKYNLSFTLLADPEHEVARKYAAYGPKRVMGQITSGILRKTYVLDSNKRIIKIWDEVKPKGHALEVLEYIVRHKPALHGGQIENRQDMVQRGHSHKRLAKTTMRRKALEARQAL